MFDPKQYQIAVLETAMRVLTVKAGGEIIISKNDYLNYVKEGIHFHYEKIGNELKFIAVSEEQCPYNHESEYKATTPIFGPTGRRIS